MAKPSGRPNRPAVEEKREDGEVRGADHGRATTFVPGRPGAPPEPRENGLLHRLGRLLPFPTADAGPPSTNGSKWGRYGRRPILLLALVGFIDSVDKGILPGVLALVQDDLGFSDSQAGILGSVFVLMTFVATLPAGYLADRFRRTRIIATTMVSWGAISAMNAAVQNFLQFAAVRAALGVGETVDDPASQSLVSDYYEPSRRGRAYALLRAFPTIGSAVGLGVGGVVGAIFGWRAAFLIVGVPGSLLAVAIWRLPEPERGEHDALEDHEGADAGSEAEEDGDARSTGSSSLASVTSRPFKEDLKEASRVRSLRALMIGSAISQGATFGFGFWAAAFYERHTSLSAGSAAGLVGGLILIGAIVGTFVGGSITDRIRDRIPGAPMLFAGAAQFVSAIIFATTFFPVPLWWRIPGQVLGVMLLVSGFPALLGMLAEVVYPKIRGVAFSLRTFLGALASAVSPLLIGFLADQFSFVADGEVQGHLSNAFLAVTPLVAIGALVVLQGRRHVPGDLEHARQRIMEDAEEGAIGS